MAKRFISYLNNYEVEMKEKGKATFRSYISDLISDEDEEEGVESQTEEPSPSATSTSSEEVEKSASAFFDNFLKPELLPGEHIITQAESALRFAPYSDRKQGISGNLFVTNFKVAFLTADKSSYSYKGTKYRQRNKLMDDNDIPLTSIDTVYQEIGSVSGFLLAVLSGGKKRALVLGQTVSTSSKYLEIHCKDFRIHVFGFKFVQKDQNKRVTNTLLHHSCPTRDDLLFAYEYGLNGKFKESKQQHQFYEKEDWELELSRLKCDNLWRVTDANKLFIMSTSLPEYFVVPSSLNNSDIKQAADQYNEKRLPTWCYTYTKSAATLVRMSQLLPESDFKQCEEKMLTAVKNSCGNAEVDVKDLSQLCPSLADIRSSSQRLMAICMTDSSKDFYSLDSTWLSRLHSTQWLQHVATCLSVAASIAEQMLDKNHAVVLKEETGFDVSCIISCLVQLLLDARYRTQEGFAAVVQREWVVMGHPFQRRNRLIQGKDSERSPVFLLFLDCVWQLLQQFPSCFAFTETFLTTLWDTLQLAVTDTFLFDSAWHRSRFFRESTKPSVPSCLPSAWDWQLQFSEEDILLFNNPLFLLNTKFDLPNVIASARGSLSRSGRSCTVNNYHHTLSAFHSDCTGLEDLFKRPSCEVLLPVSTTAARLQLWSQCYLRWCVPAQILGGGRPAGYLQQCLLVEEVIFLDHKLKLLEEQKAQRERGKERFSRPRSGLVFSLETRSPLDSVHVTSSFPFPAAVTAQTQHKLISGPLSLYLHDSLMQYDYTDSED